MNLAPLEPNAFAAWFHRRHRGKGRPPSWREWLLLLEMEPNEEGRRFLIHLAARTRRWQRLGIYDAIHEERSGGHKAVAQGMAEEVARGVVVSSAVAYRQAHRDLGRGERGR